MKKILYCLPILVVAFSACKKKRTESCQFNQTDFYYNGTRLSSFTYVIDNSGKILEKKIVPFIATNTASEKYNYNCD